MEYIKGTLSENESIRIDLVQNGNEPDVLKIEAGALLFGVKEFKSENGETVRLTPKQRVDILGFLKSERKKLTDTRCIKTCQSWKKSGLCNFTDYFMPGDEVDKDVVDYVMKEGEPASFSLCCMQPHNGYVVTDKGVEKEVYITFHSIGELRYEYDGLCLKGKNENQKPALESVVRIEKLISEAMKELKKYEDASRSAHEPER